MQDPVQFLEALNAPNELETKLSKLRVQELGKLRDEHVHFSFPLPRHSILFGTGKYINTLLKLVSYFIPDDEVRKNQDVMREVFPEYAVQILEKMYGTLILGPKEMVHQTKQFLKEFFAFPNVVVLLADVIRRGSALIRFHTLSLLSHMALFEPFYTTFGDEYYKMLLQPKLMDSIFSIIKLERDFAYNQFYRKDGKYKYIAHPNLIKRAPIDSSITTTPLDDFMHRLSYLCVDASARLLAALMYASENKTEYQDAIVYHPLFPQFTKILSNHIFPEEYPEDSTLRHFLEIICCALPCPFGIRKGQQTGVTPEMTQRYYKVLGVGPKTGAPVLAAMVATLKIIEKFVFGKGIPLFARLKASKMKFPESNTCTDPEIIYQYFTVIQMCLAILSYCSEITILAKTIDGASDPENGWMFKYLKEKIECSNEDNIIDLAFKAHVSQATLEKADPAILLNSRNYSENWSRMCHPLPSKTASQFILYDNLMKIRGKRIDKYRDLRLLAAESLKNWTNTNFFPQKLGMCGFCYTFSFRVIDNLSSEQANKQKSVYLANRALCEMNGKEFEQALHSINWALEYNPKYEKAIQRKKQIEETMQQQMLDDALNHI